jgi:hypothetical protein
MPVRAATRVFPRKGSPLPDAATPKGKLRKEKIFYYNIFPLLFGHFVRDPHTF